MGSAFSEAVSLQFIAAMLAAIMAIAWRSFDRPRHAMTWAAAFGVAMTAWFSNFLFHYFAIDSAVSHALVSALSCLFNALIALGFVQRRDAKASGTPLMLGWAVAALIITIVSFVVPHTGIRDATWLFFGGIMLVISAARVSRHPISASLPEQASIAMLTLFAAIEFGTGAIALGQGAGDDAERLMIFRIVLQSLYPPAFIGVGLFTVFLVAADLAEKMRLLATSDLLTGILNRRGFEEAAERAILNAQRQGQPLTMVVADIDRFKAINDRFGHTMGDRAIQHFAGRVERMIRRGDLVGRIGGEEFAILLINTAVGDAVDVVERIRRDVSSLPVNGPEAIVMTASFGITGLMPGDEMLMNLFGRADRALYRSKMEGRDRITVAEGLPPVPDIVAEVS